MSTELKTTCDRVTFTRFAGGLVRGTCVQVTEKPDGEPHRFVQLTRAEAAQVAAHLLQFAAGAEQEADEDEEAEIAAPRASAALTDLEAKLLDWIAMHEMTPLNGMPPAVADDAVTYLWADEMATSLGITEKAVGGVITSLTNKGFVYCNIESAQAIRNGDHSTIGHTAKGFEAWEQTRTAK